MHTIPIPARTRGMALGSSYWRRSASMKSTTVPMNPPKRTAIKPASRKISAFDLTGRPFTRWIGCEASERDKPGLNIKVTFNTHAKNAINLID